MTDTVYDMVILGAGSGGYAAALRGAQLGLRVALIEADKVGGTCLHRGCVPTKAILHAAETADTVREASVLGIRAALEGIDMPAVKTYKDGIISRMYKGLQGLVASRGIDLIQGWGRLVAPDAVEVDGRRITGKNIVLASGSYSKDIGQEISGPVMTSEQALELDHVPASAVILGGGVIGVEFASAWASLGCQVTIIEGLPRLVPNEDEAISKQLERAFRKRKIAFRTSTMFESVERHEDSVTVRAADGTTYYAEVLLIAVGRGPATANLGYEEAGVAMDRGFVLADEYGRTNVPGVWAVGDIVPGVQLAHRGFAQGIVVAEKIAGLDPTPVDDVLVPKVTFCEPEIASVGLSEAAAKELHGEDAITTAEFNVAGNAKSQILGTQGFVKLVSLKDGPILGFHAIGARMGEQVGEGQLMVSWEADAHDVASLVHAHPTQNETLGEAAMALAGKPLHNHG
ncbi:dihydrolipoyl dehydrogenase [Actinomyces sp. Chiba101]|uniref:dihydrolipoyl dehydrogenase n=1 Tax=Actinomyces TaxID=1654 RepID=UPI000974ECD7|nr:MULTISPECIES: dihydrolipoyl dehydrogenase [Actinomyces]BAW93246.1 dihydrolipoyl dehydrogenase [Actinomyces sp. Chiba101]GAV95520.1 dihydrolipoyl dehydrogenase [Actinomyces denticolens]SUU04127.1 Dihydrolipoyl dehydrogenase [Actinomyces denticolens]